MKSKPVIMDSDVGVAGRLTSVSYVGPHAVNLARSRGRTAKPFCVLWTEGGVAKAEQPILKEEVVVRQNGRRKSRANWTGRTVSPECRSSVLNQER